MAKTVTNSQIDSLAAAVPAPYGPLTRVSNWETDFPEPNSEVRGAFTSNIGSTEVWLSYTELTNTIIRDRVIAQAHDWTAVVTDLKTAISALNTMASAMSAPHTYADYQSLVDEFRNNFPWLYGSIGAG